MVLSRALPRGYRALGALRKLQAPNLSSQFHTSVYESPNKIVINDASLLHRPSLYFNAFQRFGISSSASPDPSGKENAKANFVTDTYSLKAELAELVEETIAFKDTEEKDIEGINCRLSTFAETIKVMADSGIECDAEIKMDMCKLFEEVDELMDAKVELIEEIDDKVVGTLENVMTRTGFDKENSEILGLQNSAQGLEDVIGNLGRASTHVQGSFAEIDESEDVASFHDQLEIARKHLSHMKTRSEELRSQLKFKLAELQKRVELLK